MSTAADPKNLMANIIANHISKLPRTRSGKGWFLASGFIQSFIESIMTELFSEKGIAVFYFSPDNSALYWMFLNKHFQNNQECAEAMMEVMGFEGMRTIRKIIMETIDGLPHAGGWFNRRISNEKEKTRVLSKIVDESFEKKNDLAIDTMQNFLIFLVPILAIAKRKSSTQDAVDYAVRELKKRYKSSG